MRYNIKLLSFVAIIFVFILFSVLLILADSNGISHSAEDITPGVLGADEDLSPIFMLDYLFPGIIYDWNNPDYFLDPDGISNVTELYISSGNIINNCFEQTAIDYSTLSCPGGYQGYNMYNNGTHWTLTCCKYE